MYLPASKDRFLTAPCRLSDEEVEGCGECGWGDRVGGLRVGSGLEGPRSLMVGSSGKSGPVLLDMAATYKTKTGNYYYILYRRDRVRAT